MQPIPLADLAPGAYFRVGANLYRRPPGHIRAARGYIPCAVVGAADPKTRKWHLIRNRRMWKLARIDRSALVYPHRNLDALTRWPHSRNPPETD